MTNINKQSIHEYLAWMRRGHALKIGITLGAFASCAFEHWMTIVFLGALLILLVLETNNISRQYGKVDGWLKE